MQQQSSGVDLAVMSLSRCCRTQETSEVRPDGHERLVAYVYGGAATPELIKLKPLTCRQLKTMNSRLALR